MSTKTDVSKYFILDKPAEGFSASLVRDALKLHDGAVILRNGDYVHLVTSALKPNSLSRDISAANNGANYGTKKSDSADGASVAGKPRVNVPSYKSYAVEFNTSDLTAKFYFGMGLTASWNVKKETITFPVSVSMKFFDHISIANSCAEFVNGKSAGSFQARLGTYTGVGNSRIEAKKALKAILSSLEETESDELLAKMAEVVYTDPVSFRADFVSKVEAIRESTSKIQAAKMEIENMETGLAELETRAKNESSKLAELRKATKEAREESKAKPKDRELKIASQNALVAEQIKEKETKELQTEVAERAKAIEAKKAVLVELEQEHAKL